MIPHRNQAPDEDVMEAIELAILCRDLKVLPRAGGLLDQDSYHVWLMDKVFAAMDKRTNQEANKTNSVPGRVPKRR